MKHLIATILLVAGTSVSLFSQCNPFYVIKENGEWHAETYNGKGKLTGKIKQKVTDFSVNGAGFDARINALIEDEKGKEVHQGEYVYHCKDGIVYVDMRNYIPQESLKAFGDAKLVVEGEDLEIPSSLSPGQQLKDGSISVTTEGAPIPFSLTCTVTDRKVVGKETVNTPMGNIECFKVTSVNTIKSKMGVGVTVTMNVVEWIAPQYGVVKSETYSKNDKLVGYTLLAYKN